MEKNTTALNEQEHVADNNEGTVTGGLVQEMLDVAENEGDIKPSSSRDELHEEIQKEPLEEIPEETQEGAPDELLPDYSTKSLKEITQLFQDMLERGDQQELYKYSEVIKASFYKVLKREKIAVGMYIPEQADAVPEDGENTEVMEKISNNPFAEIERGFKQLYSQYKDGRQSYIQNIEKTKEDNLAKKLEIIDELRALLEKAEDVNLTFPTFRELQNRWKAINNLIPQARAKDLWESYQHCVEKFYDYIKINNEFRDLDFKKNLEAKILICEKAEALDSESNVINAFKELQKLHEEWKELGPVAKDQRESIWERFRTITSVINKKHQHFFENLKDMQKGNLEAKTTLCEQAEELATQEMGNSSEWNALSKQMEVLQAKWKGIGFAAKKDNQKIYDRFRAACDKFYNAKRDYYSDFKNVMQENLRKKEELCEQAEALMASEDWKKATDQLINLQKVWKEIGPVARKQSDVVWKRFRSACDHFFEKKSTHFGQVDEKFEENMAAKLALLEDIKAYKLSESKDENVSAMRDFVSRWNAIGFVPFKEKEKIQAAFNKVMDSQFLDIRSLDSEKKLTKFKKMVSDAKSTGKDRNLRFERDKLIQRFRKMEGDIATLENNMGFFAKSKNADLLIADIQKKIAIAKAELTQIEEKIKLIDKQFE